MKRLPLSLVRWAAVAAGVSLWLLLITACNTTKYIPPGEYLLDKVVLRTDESPDVDKDALLPYIQQKPNASRFGPGVYNLVRNDSNFIKKFIRRMGERPVLFNNQLVAISVNELSRQLQNMGYLRSTVSAQVDTLGKKATVTYLIRAGEPYYIRHYTIDLPQLSDSLPATPPRRVLRFPQRNRRRVREGAVFDLDLLAKERTRVSSLLRNRGYYTFTEDHLHYRADTALQSNQVDLTLTLTDSTRQAVPYTLRHVNIFSGYDSLTEEDYRITDSLTVDSLHLYYDRLHFLRPGLIRNKVSIRPGQLYRERQNNSTYNQLQALNAIGRIDIRYEPTPADSTLLDCNIYLTPANNHSLQTAFGGTNKAGDLGVALDITYGNHNLFNGSETFNLHLRGAYELVARRSHDALVHNYYELGISPSLLFPKLHLPWIGRFVAEHFRATTGYSLGYNIQRRPEYIRNFFNFSWKFHLSSPQSRLTQTLSLIDINYAFIPWKSEQFVDYLHYDVNELTRISYNNIFTAGINYSLIYTNTDVGHLHQHLYTIRFSIETSGNALYALSRATHASRSADGEYMLFDNPFAQYAKSDFHVGETFPLNANSSLAFRAGIGLAYPYANSAILPFEKRYYGGGPNHVRGWSTRYLGPGAMRTTGNLADHVGDLNLILGAEYRYKLLPWFEPALFVDAGNIWTLREYPNQPGGRFRWNTFYREIAVGTGLGLRFDFHFLLFRIDAGTQLYDPSLRRSVFFRGRFFKQSALYVAIGYPF